MPTRRFYDDAAAAADRDRVHQIRLNPSRHRYYCWHLGVDLADDLPVIDFVARADDGGDVPPLDDPRDLCAWVGPESAPGYHAAVGRTHDSIAKIAIWTTR